jgi:hypothetical protein
VDRLPLQPPRLAPRLVGQLGLVGSRLLPITAEAVAEAEAEAVSLLQARARAASPRQAEGGARRERARQAEALEPSF